MKCILICLLCSFTWQVLAEKPVEKNVVFICGDVEAPYGLNEFRAGTLLLVDALQEVRPELGVKVYENEWPADSNVVLNADVLVFYTQDKDDLISDHHDQIAAAISNGAGVVSILYDLFAFDGIEKKTVQRWGHMDYEQEQYNLFTPVLTHLQDDNTFTVNQLLLGVPVFSDGTRHHMIFGGHWHWAWGQTYYRRVALQCIVQSANLNQKRTGFKLSNLSFEDLQKNLDVEPPADFDLEPIKRHVIEWNKTADEKPLPSPWWNSDLRPYDVADEDDRGEPVQGRGKYDYGKEDAPKK